MSKLLLIGLAGFIGTLGRYRMAELIAKRYGGTFPAGTLIVNLVGCFLVGLFFYLLEERFLVNHTARAAILIGFLGGFTTFSSFGLETFSLLQNGIRARPSKRDGFESRRSNIGLGGLHPRQNAVKPPVLI
jgi:fluoride exporter